MCPIDAHEINNPSEHDDGSRGGFYSLTSNSTTEALVSLSTTINFIGCWLKDLEHNFLKRCHMYIFAMKKWFHKIPVEIPKPLNPKEKHQ